MRADEPAGVRSIDKAKCILREASRRLLEMADALAGDDGLTAKTERSIERELAKDVPLEEMPAGESGGVEEETPRARMPKEKAAGLSAGGKSGDLGDECALSAAAGPVERGQPVNGEPGGGRKNRRGWDL